MSATEVTMSEATMGPGGYRILELLSEAGGVNNCGIYLAAAPSTDDLVICKQRDDGDVWVEAHVARQLTGFAHLVSLLDYFPASKTNKNHSLYFGYCDQGTLEDLRLRHYLFQTKIPESFIWHVLLSMAKALEACHTGLGKPDWEPIAHRDVHRGNILLSAPKDPAEQYPEVYLADFGRAEMGVARNQEAMQSDIAHLAFTVFDLCSADEEHGPEIVNDLKSRVENGLFGYSEELRVVLSILMDYQEAEDEDIARRPIEELVPWIEELRGRAEMQEYEGELILE
ncbi:hypothetical protein DM02DRAFT_630240 [Periconia macrospinosa]|uniref:non-specific serine/threonine protein kinase n=1 Tax=Periconia macrospinosa TaxID=97972 RepID=A0A2V1DKS3_9PLEO|nr:hypothetical protein DM02DRAFT_630240 [Periconia macrospinosa]